MHSLHNANDRVQDQARTSDLPHVVILMATYNGAEFLQDQLDSFVSQAHTNWSLIASDDGSSDDTRTILSQFALSHSVQIKNGPQEGPSVNFLSMMDAVADDVPYVAFSDQDDVWLETKLSEAVAQLADVSPDTPALYCGRRTVWNGTQTKKSRNYPRQPSFSNALIENIAPGNTIVLNAAAIQLIKEYAQTATDVYAVDWWMYQLISGVGGTVIYDPNPHIMYRQHKKNVVGAGENFRNYWANKIGVLRNLYATRLRRNHSALLPVKGMFLEKNQQAIEAMNAAKSANLFERVRLVLASGAYRQSKGSTLMFYLAVVLGKI